MRPGTGWPTCGPGCSRACACIASTSGASPGTSSTIPTSEQYSRISEEAYRFIGLLNGRRTVSEVWRICNEQLGDRAPTQGEVIQLLGQLHAANLLYVELAPDSEALFNRYRKRVTREVQNYLMNLLFLRIPLLDPNRFLDRWVGIFGWVFSWLGLVLWLALVGTGAVLRDRRHPRTCSAKATTCSTRATSSFST